MTNACNSFCHRFLFGIDWKYFTRHFSIGFDSNLAKIYALEQPVICLSVSFSVNVFSFFFSNFQTLWHTVFQTLDEIFWLVLHLFFALSFSSSFDQTKWIVSLSTLEINFKLISKFGDLLKYAYFRLYTTICSTIIFYMPILKLHMQLDEFCSASLFLRCSLVGKSLIFSSWLEFYKLSKVDEIWINFRSTWKIWPIWLENSHFDLIYFL